MELTPQPHHTRRIYLLGQLRIEIGSRPITLRGGKIRSLFAYLVLHPQRRHSREFLANLLWPDASISRVRRNFSDALYRLRQALGPDWLLVDRETVGLNVTADLWVDVWAFEEGMKLGKTAVLGSLIACYTDDLLPEIYDDWILERRLSLRETYLNGLLRLGHAAEEQNYPEIAQSHYHRLTHADPLREEAHRGLMRSFAHQGRLPDALAAYDKLKQLLEAELGVPPAQETQALFEQLRSELSLTQKAAALLPSQLVQRPFVGRVKERFAILTAVESAIAGRGGVMAIEGEAGMGKSRLLQEIKSGAQWRGAALLAGHATEYPTASPYAPLSEALADILASPRAAQLETILAPETLAACSPLHPPWINLTSLPELPPEHARRRFHQALTAVFCTLADFSSHALVLDDLHWADAALWDALDALVPTLRQHRLLLLLAYRRSDIEKRAGWKTLQKWEREGYLTVLSLPALVEDEIKQLLPPNMEEEAPRVLASAGGNPFFISEMLFDLAAGHAPYRRTALARTESLSASARAALETAAVLGSELPYLLWAAITRLPPVKLAQVGETLVERYLLKPSQNGYVFTHDLIQEAIYQTIKPAHRLRLHRRVAEALASQDADNSRARAFHLDRGGMAAEAIAMYRRAADLEQAAYAFVEAQAALTRALTLMPIEPTTERVETLLTLAQACQVTGDKSQQKSALEEALQGVNQMDDDALRLRTLIQIGDYAAKADQQRETKDYLTEALSLAKATAERQSQMETHLVWSDWDIRNGRYQAAQTRLELALALARELALPQQEARALDGIGYALMHTSDEPQTAVTYFERALAVQRSAGDKFGESRTLSNLLSAFQNLGAWDRTLAMADEVLAAQEAIGYRLGTAVARQAQGLAACMLGDFNLAQTALSIARDNFAAVGEQLGVGVALNALGLVAERRGNLVDAADIYQEALTIAETAVAPTFIAFAQQDLGWVCVQMGRAAVAIPLLKAAAAVWAKQGDKLNDWRCQASLGLALLETGDVEKAQALAEAGWAASQDAIPSGEEPQIWLWMLYRLLTAVHRPNKAADALRAAYRELQRQAQVITDEKMRRRFFARVPLHQKIVAAHDDLTDSARYIHVRLATKDAPLGRALTPDEMVTVRWTISAPEDTAVSNKAQLRRHCLRRLLREADKQGAAPTDHDLAQALGVSRRTILRDMERLTQAGVVLPTRRRR